MSKKKKAFESAALGVAGIGLAPETPSVAVVDMPGAPDLPAVAVVSGGPNHLATAVASPEPRRAIEYLPIDSLSESPTNPRKYFDQAKLEELAESIGVSGLLQPIVVRLIPLGATGQPGSAELPRASSPSEIPGALGGAEELIHSVRSLQYEIVFGNRRFRAAKLAALGAVPCIIREMSDEDALLAQLVENAQREDTNAMEEAEGIASLSIMGGYSKPGPNNSSTPDVDRIAERLGKSRRYVYDRLSLAAKLCHVARLAVARKLLEPSCAVEVARLEHPDQRLFLHETFCLSAVDSLDAELASRTEPGTFSYRQTVEWVKLRLRKDDTPELPLEGEPAEVPAVGIDGSPSVSMSSGATGQPSSSGLPSAPLPSDEPAAPAVSRNEPLDPSGDEAREAQSRREARHAEANADAKGVAEAEKKTEDARFTEAYGLEIKRRILRSNAKRGTLDEVKTLALLAVEIEGSATNDLAEIFGHDIPLADRVRSTLKLEELFDVALLALIGTDYLVLNALARRRKLDLNAIALEVKEKLYGKVEPAKQAEPKKKPGAARAKPKPKNSGQPRKGVADRPTRTPEGGAQASDGSGNASLDAGSRPRGPGKKKPGITPMQGSAKCPDCGVGIFASFVGERCTECGDKAMAEVARKAGASMARRQNRADAKRFVSAKPTKNAKPHAVPKSRPALRGGKSKPKPKPKTRKP